MPSGDEEMLPGYPIDFVDRKAVIESKHVNETDHEISIPDFTPDRPVYEFRLAKLTNYLKRQGYPLGECFVSYFSSIFQVYINCGCDPIPRSLYIN